MYWKCNRRIKQYDMKVISMAIKIPKYVESILARSEYEFDFTANNENYAAGYTIRIKKATTQTQADTFRKEIQRFLNWVQREYKKKYHSANPISFLLSAPAETHYRNQYAIVTIFDPIMKDIESYIKR